MKTISLSLPERLLEASGRHSTALRIPRAEYIRRAIEQLNEQMDAETRARRMRKAALKCRAADLEVNADFAAIEQAPED
jgi:metal-responsive CopG/Arc/MetJ family transcriptional regulator